MNPENSTTLALQHARELFIYHAGQRIQSLNFYFVAITVFLTGFGFLATSKMEPEDRAFVGIVLAFGGFCITRLCQRLDKRNEQLVHCDEALLQKVEARMATEDSELQEWKVTDCGREEDPAIPHYSIIAPRLFDLYKALSIIGGIYSVWPWTKAVLGL